MREKEPKGGAVNFNGDTTFTTEEIVNGGAGAGVGLVGWQKLPENKLAPLMRALVEVGPVAVAVATPATWNFYTGGVMDSCEPHNVINHAVVLTGFGAEGPQNYWQIQNSWGMDWGEQGFIRLLRRDAEEQHCGWDTRPKEGTACEGGPARVRVCGTCGILYDAVIPKFKLSATGLWHKLGKHSPGA